MAYPDGASDDSGPRGLIPLILNVDDPPRVLPPKLPPPSLLVGASADATWGYDHPNKTTPPTLRFGQPQAHLLHLQLLLPGEPAYAPPPHASTPAPHMESQIAVPMGPGAPPGAGITHAPPNVGPPPPPPGHDQPMHAFHGSAPPHVVPPPPNMQHVPHLPPGVIPGIQYPMHPMAGPHIAPPYPMMHMPNYPYAPYPGQMMMSPQMPLQNRHRRFRRRYYQINRKFNCSFPGCTKSYGLLNHLNTHIVTKKHGSRKSKSDFKQKEEESDHDGMASTTPSTSTTSVMTPPTNSAPTPSTDTNTDHPEMKPENPANIDGHITSEVSNPAFAASEYVTSAYAGPSAGSNGTSEYAGPLPTSNTAPGFAGSPPASHNMLVLPAPKLTKQHEGVRLPLLLSLMERSPLL